MKINEIVTENPLSWAKSVIPGTRANTEKKIKSNFSASAKPYVYKWNQAVVANPNLNTPKELHKYATKMATNRNGEQIFQINPPTSMSPRAVNDYITNVYSRVVSGVENDPQQAVPQQATPQQAVPNQQSQSPKQSNIIVPDSYRTRPKDKQQNFGGWQQGTTAQTQMASGVRVINQDPIIIKYGNREFGLNDNGEWTHLKSGKVPPESIQAFLSQQHDTSLGI